MKKAYKIALLIILLTALTTGAILYYLQQSTYIFGNFRLDRHWRNIEQVKEEKYCWDFLTKSMSREDGAIYTNYLDAEPIEDLSGGHEILSESEGIAMLYSVNRGDKASFDKHFNIVVNDMLMENNLIKWRLPKKAGQISSSSASVDDLRIVRAVFYGYDRWQDTRYKDYLIKFVRAVRKYEIKEKNLVDFYDAETKLSDNKVTLSYLDLHTMDMLAQLDKSWVDIRQNGYNIIKSGYISDKLPLYQKTYNYELKAYGGETEINIIDSMLTALHLSEAGQCPWAVLDWIKKQLEERAAIYISYDKVTGEPVSTLESTAGYALCARVALELGDKELYDELIEKMLKYQIAGIGTNEKSRLYGAFGDPITEEVYSFDNLQALLALQEPGGNNE